MDRIHGATDVEVLAGVSCLRGSAPGCAGAGWDSVVSSGTGTYNGVKRSSS